MLGTRGAKAGTFTLGNLDSLGMGALLAYVKHAKISRHTIQKYLSGIILPVGILLYVATLVLYHYRIKPSVFFALNDFAVSMIFVCLIDAAATGIRG